MDESGHPIWKGIVYSVETLNKIVNVDARHEVLFTNCDASSDQLYYMNVLIGAKKMRAVDRMVMGLLKCSGVSTRKHDADHVYAKPSVVELCATTTVAIV